MLFPFFTGSVPILSEVLVLGITFEVHFPWVQHVTLRSAGSHVVATQTVAWTAKGDHIVTHIDAPEIPLGHNHKNSIVCHGNLQNFTKQSVIGNIYKTITKIPYKCHFICLMAIFISKKKNIRFDTVGRAQERRRVLLQPGSLLIMTGGGREVTNLKIVVGNQYKMGPYKVGPQAQLEMGWNNSYKYRVFSPQANPLIRPFIEVIIPFITSGGPPCTSYKML